MRLVRERLLELDAQNEDIAICDQSALDAALMLDRLEKDDAPYSTELQSALPALTKNSSAQISLAPFTSTTPRNSP